MEKLENKEYISSSTEFHEILQEMGFCKLKGCLGVWELREDIFPENTTCIKIWTNGSFSIHDEAKRLFTGNYKTLLKDEVILALIKAVDAA